MSTTKLFGDITDSRDVIERIEELETDLLEECNAARQEDDAPCVEYADDDAFTYWLKAQAEAGNPDAEELIALRAFAEEAEGYSSDWRHGEAIIADHYFEEYAEELANDIGAIDSRADWPLHCIDWVKAAAELKIDYTSIDYQGRTYWMRCC